MLKIALTERACRAIARRELSLAEVVLHLDDAIVDESPYRIDGNNRVLCNESDVIRTVDRDNSEHAVEMTFMPHDETPCDGCRFAGRMPLQQVEHRKVPGAAVCIHPAVPLLERRSAARAFGGACGSGADLRQGRSGRPHYPAAIHAASLADWPVAEPVADADELPTLCGEVMPRRLVTRANRAAVTCAVCAAVADAAKARGFRHPISRFDAVEISMRRNRDRRMIDIIRPGQGRGCVAIGAVADDGKTYQAISISTAEWLPLGTIIGPCPHGCGWPTHPGGNPA